MPYFILVFGGSELCYTKFSQGEPVFEKNCLYLDPKKNFEWFSGLCEDERHDFICEIGLFFFYLSISALIMCTV